MMKNQIYEFRVHRYRSRAAETVAETYLREPSQVAELLRTLTKNLAVEKFFAIYLNAKNRVIGYEVVASGTLTEVSVHPREVFRGAILASAAALIVGHNHPSGDATPSTEDLEITHRLKKVGVLLGIPVLDHIIVGDHGYSSGGEDRDS